MPNSLRFDDLRQRLSSLRKNLLPGKFSPTGIYSDKQLDRARSYRLLCHAEIESFLEDIAKAKVIEKIRDWKNSKIPSDLLICFLCCYHSNWEYDDESSSENTITKTKVKDKAEEIIDFAMIQYNRIIQENHGLKVKNIKQLFIPIGIRMNDLDPLWLTEMDQFGERRGAVAHTTVSMHQVIDPRSEYQTVQTLLVGLKRLDELVFSIG